MQWMLPEKNHAARFRISTNPDVTINCTNHHYPAGIFIYHIQVENVILEKIMLNTELFFDKLLDYGLCIIFNPYRVTPILQIANIDHIISNSLT